MSDSLVVSTSVQNSTTRQTFSESKTVTRTGRNEQHGRIDVGTSEETLTVGSDIGSLGVVKFINRDATHFVEVGIATASYFSKIPAGETAQFPAVPTITTWYLKADTATVDFEYHFWEV